jgi:transposase-like protein
VAERMLQELIEAEATAHIGAEWNEHTASRTALRNGHRDKVLTTLAGDLDLEIPKVRTGSFFPSLLERRRRIDQALYAVIMEAYVHGVSTRSVDDLVKALGGDTGISKSEVSRICAALDEPLTVFRTRPLDHTRFPYVYLDATYCKVRVNHQIVSQAVVIATRITDNHSGLVAAVRKVMLGAAWQRCRVHFLRNVFGVIDKESGEMVAATIRTIFSQPTADLVRTQLDTVADMLGSQFPKVRAMLLDAKEDLTAFADFPPSAGGAGSLPTPTGMLPTTSPPVAGACGMRGVSHASLPPHNGVSERRSSPQQPVGHYLQARSFRTGSS